MRLKGAGDEERNETDPTLRREAGWVGPEA